MKILVLSPHRDDAAFSLSLSIEKWLDEGHTVAVGCCFTRSKYAPYGREVIGNETEIIESVTTLRAEEDSLWAANYRTGLSLVDLRIEDAPLRLGCKENEVCGYQVNNETEPAYRICTAIESLKPDAIVLPLALGLHVDHVTTRDAGLRWSVGEGLPVALYEDLPYAARPGGVKEIDVATSSISLRLTSGFVQSRLDGKIAMRRKFFLSSVYRSQIDGTVVRDISQFCLRYGGRERLWATDRWQRSQLALVEESAAEPAR